MNGEGWQEVAGAKTSPDRNGLPRYLGETPAIPVYVFWALLFVLMFEETVFVADWIDTVWYQVAWKVCLNGVVSWWVYADASRRDWDEERQKSYALFSAVITEIVLPVYLVKSRGWKGAGVTVFRFLLYLVLFLLFLIGFESALGA